jgi:hypothetical protein
MSLFINGFFPGELTPSTTVAGCIDIFENVWPNPDNTIKMAEEACSDPNSGVFWERAGTIGQGAFQNARTNSILSVTSLAKITNNPALQNIHNQFYMMLLSAVIPYSKKYGIQETLYPEDFGLLKYQDGQEYRSHYDGGSSMVPRIVTALCYLNGDYEGGELEFPNFKIKIKPEPGMLILFPSNYTYTHVAHPVTNGTKYSLVTWLRDQPL